MCVVCVWWVTLGLLAMCVCFPPPPPTLHGAALGVPHTSCLHACLPHHASYMAMHMFPWMPIGHWPRSTLGGGSLAAALEGERVVHAASPAHMVPTVPHPICTRGDARRGGWVDAHVRQLLYALYAMWREGIGSPSAYPSVCARFPTPDLHARRCMARRAGWMLTHSCHDALTLARHATATRAGRLPARHDATD